MKSLLSKRQCCLFYSVATFRSFKNEFLFWINGVFMDEFVEIKMGFDGSVDTIQVQIFCSHKA